MSPGVQFVTEEDIKYIPAEWARSGGRKALRLPLDFPREHVNFLPP